MGDISKNLSRHEMACKCGCGFDTVDVELGRVIQQVCFEFAQRTGQQVYLIVTGPNRCRAHNAATPGASENSQHLYGRAMDFILKSGGVYISPQDIYTYINETWPDQYGLGLYSNRVHFDTRTNGPARWDER